MNKYFYKSLRIAIHQIDEYLIDRKNLSSLVFSLETTVNQILDKEIKEYLDQEWSRLEVINATLLDQNSDPDERQLKRIDEILRNFKNKLEKECNCEEEDPLSWPYPNSAR